MELSKLIKEASQNGLFLRGQLHETRTNSDQYEFVLLSLHSFYAFTWDWPKNELRAVCLRVGRWPDTSYFVLV